MIRVTKKLLNILTKMQRYMVVLLGVLMFIGGLVESLSITLMLPLITTIMDAEQWQEKWYAKMICNLFKVEDQRTYIETILLILIAIFLFKNLFLLGEYYLQYSFIAKSRMNMQKNLMRAYMLKPYEFFLNASTGEVMRIIQGDVEQSFSLLSIMISFYTEVIVALFVAITIVVVSPQIAWRLFIILGIELLMISLVFKPVMKRMGEEARKESSLASKWLLQAIGGIKSIKVSHTEKFFEEKYIYHVNKITNIERKNQTLGNIPRLLIEAFTISGVLLVVFIMVHQGMNLIELIPQLTALVFAAIRLLPSINRISSAINQAPYLEGALDNVINILKTENVYRTCERSDDVELCVTDKISEAISDRSFSALKSIKFSHIDFAYTGSEKKVFVDSTFDILPGQSVGIVGASGAGKTTAVDLILGLLKPSAGKILIDGVDIEENMTAWLSRLAYIPQSIFLMDDTISANVGFGRHRREIEDERVWRALQEAQMEDFVRSLPENILTKVGEQGVRLSGGQRQRIGIARALYNDPDVLFFDEATSALDNETEAAIMESISNLKGKKTLVIIAHRLTTIENCDVVFRVENGTVVKEK